MMDSAGIPEAEMRAILTQLEAIARNLSSFRSGILNVRTPFGNFHYIPQTISPYCSFVSPDLETGIPRYCGKRAKYRVTEKGQKFHICADHMKNAIDDFDPDEILIHIPKDSLKHPGNNVQLKLKMSAFVKAMETVLLASYHI